jgi:uncharacterized protein YciU (UPF0263 family)
VLDGLVYIVGGGEEGRDVLRFDPASDVWSSLAATSRSHSEGVSFVLGGCLYAAGGEDREGERYDLASNTWDYVADMLVDRDSFGAVTIGAAGPAEEQDLFDSLITKASSERL